jgi:hypothetical protein
VRTLTDFQDAKPGYLDGQDQGRYLNVDEVKIWYTTYGVENSSLTPVLFLHGGTGNVRVISTCAVPCLLLVQSDVPPGEPGIEDSYSRSARVSSFRRSEGHFG